MMTATHATPTLSGDYSDGSGVALDVSGASPATDTQRDIDFEREALPWIDDVYRFALSLTRDDADADDVVQETYLRAYRSWHTFQPGSDARRWLFTITRNVFLRSPERKPRHVDLEDGDLEAVSSFAATDQG